MDSSGGSLSDAILQFSYLKGMMTHHIRHKSELIAAIVAESGIDKSTVTEVLKTFEDVVVGSVSRGEKVVLSGFLSFERVERKARIARNPQTGEAIQVRASRAPRVSIGATFKKAIKNS